MTAPRYHFVPQEPRLLRWLSFSAPFIGVHSMPVSYNDACDVVRWAHDTRNERDDLQRRMDAVRALCEQAIDRCEGHYARGGPVSGVLDGAEAHARYVIDALDGEAGDE